MKNTILNNTVIARFGLAALLCTLLLPVSVFAASVESDVKEYLKDKDPQSLDDYPPTFTDVYGKHAPLIKETTQVTVIHYFTESDVHTYDDIATLTGYAVEAAIAEARKDGDEADLAAFITDAVCGSFKGGINAAYKQVASAEYAIKGGLAAALAAGVTPDFAATAISRGIDSCLEEKLEYEVALIVGGITPYGSYLPPGLRSGPAELVPDLPGNDTEICVSNCI